MKMKQVYESNPALGDPLSIQGQLTENGHRLDKLRSELKKFQDFLDELEGKAPSSPAVRAKDESVTDGLRSKAKFTFRNTHVCFENLIFFGEVHFCKISFLSKFTL